MERSTWGSIRHWYLGRVIYTYLELRRVNSLLTHERDRALRTLGLVEWLYELFQARQNPEVVCALLGV